MIDPIPTATYRIQLREGVGFAEIEHHLDTIIALGISHLYLSPIFAANPGSTHGYDVTDPTEIEQGLGGRAGFERLARAAHDRGIGIILDIVPNHTAFSLDNPWLRDVLVNGRSSRYANHFDIDWAAGPLVLPFLPEPFEKMLADGRFFAANGQFGFDDFSVPLAANGPSEASGIDELRDLHARQHWRLRHWEIERDGISHRRFFNVTGLIGMRVEDMEVFNDTHALIIDLVKSGLVDGLRVDHIDGLADPRTYLDRLAEALPDTPIWIEKILVGHETIPPAWKTAGTTGYEAARMIARLLTHKDGIQSLDTLWRQATSETESFETVLARAKTDILHNELAAELHALCRLATLALQSDPEVEAGPEGIREAVIALLSGMSRYRTYVDAEGASQPDRELIAQIVASARPRLRSSRILEHLAGVLLDPPTDAATAFVVRVQQVSGALLAKAQEDTAGFRWTRYLAANEVGAEPAEPCITEAEANSFLSMRRPSDMTLTSTHDTKRSEDARMRLVAISHHPEAFARLVADADHIDIARSVEPKWRWYIAQSALAIWGSDEFDDLNYRLHEHVLKAMREAKQTTFWTRPVPEAEEPATAFAAALCERWQQTRPYELEQLIGTGNALSLTQLALKCLMPGFPDIYRGSEGPFFTLTDPDNRLPVDWAMLARLSDAEGFGGDKARLTRTLLGLRKSEPAFFDTATASLSLSDDGLVLTRATSRRTLVVDHGHKPGNSGAELICQTQNMGLFLTIAWH